MEGFAVGYLLSGLTAFIQLGLNFLTAAKPDRPSWLAIVAALALGQLGAFLFATANGIVLTWQTAAQLVIVGAFAAATAAGLNYQTVKAEQKRASGQAQDVAEYWSADRRSKI